MKNDKTYKICEQKLYYLNYSKNYLTGTETSPRTSVVGVSRFLYLYTH